MPRKEDGSEWQRITLSKIFTEVGVRLTYLPTDDHYKLVDGKIFGYVKVLSANARSAGPPGGLKVIVKKETWTTLRGGLTVGNDWYGQASHHMFVTEEDATSLQAAVEILRTAKERSQR